MKPHFVYERLGGSAVDDEEEADDTEDTELGVVLDATYNSAAHRGGAWGFGGQYSHPIGDQWNLTVFGIIFPGAEESFSVLDCGCHGGPKESTHTEDKVIWQTGLRLERPVWKVGDLATILFVEVAGPGLVSQRGLDLQLGLHAALDITDTLCLYSSAGASLATAPQEDYRDAYAFARLELDCTTGWLPNGSDHWFVGTYVESGELRDEGAYVQFSAGVAFAVLEDTEIEIRVGTEVSTPYEEREDAFLQAGFSWNF